MRNFMEAYAAVHNTEAKEELTSVRDEISEMNLSALTDTDLDEIVESVLEEMFQKGYSVDSAHTIFSEMFVESTIAGRQAKIDRLCESLNKAFDVIDSKASTIALEEFGKYRYNKRLQESWSARFNQEKRVQRTHGQLVAQESLNVKTLLLQLVEKADKSYLETDMKKRQENNEKARKDMEKMGSKMKNPHFEEVSQIRKGWGDAYASIYEKKLDPVGKEDGDVDNDGDEDSSDEYLMKRRKAIGKAMGKKKEKVEQVDEGLRSAVKRLLGKKDAPAEKKPESRGEQLRKKYNVGPERSDTSAKRQILDRTRAKAERDQKEYGGSVYSKRVADKSKAAHDRYLKGGYSKYGADDRRGSGNKARRRAEALKKEDFNWLVDTLISEGYNLSSYTVDQFYDFCEEVIMEEYEVTMADKKGNTKAYQNYKAGMKNVKTGKPLYKAGKGVEESVKFSEAELKAIEEKVNSWED